ncbi:MAG: glycoside hydrolase family protein [Alphaproteobacteria bacterium]|nr:glycoside hydrolase family protein [Alphaproteobacteria bacterium]
MIVLILAWLAALYALDRYTPTPGENAVTDGADEGADSKSSSDAQPAPGSQSAPAARSNTPDGDIGNPANASLHINDAGLAIIEAGEGLRLEAYQGANGSWYIGYGHSGATPGQKITQAEAVALLREDVKGAEDDVRRLVTAPLNENEFSALVSYCFNVGGGNFGKSDILALVNAGKRQAAADAFLTHNKAGGKVLEHLTKRREQERALFLTTA